MTQTPHTKSTQPLDDPRGSNDVIDGECYVKSTEKTSTWEVPARDVSDIDVCAAVENGDNIIKWDNVDWSRTGIYGSINDARPTPKGIKRYPANDESKQLMVDWEKNPFMTLEDNKWKFKYDHGAADRTKLPWYETYRPRFGFHWCYVLKLIEPVDVPANTNIFIYSQLTRPCATWCGSKPNRDDRAFAHVPGAVMSGNCMQNRAYGGVYQQDSLTQVPTTLLPKWGGMRCSQFRYYRANPHDWRNRGMKAVKWIVTPPMYMGCGPTDSDGDPMFIRILGFGMTGGPKILTEGIDWK